MRRIAESKAEKQRIRSSLMSSFSLQPMLAVPLMPAEIPSRIRTSTLQPMCVDVQHANKAATYGLNKTPVLRSVMLELTLACNLNCIQCYCNAGRSRKDELGTEEILRFIDCVAETEVERVTFTGGEPLLHKDFLYIARHASDRGLNITVFTNGELLNKAMLVAMSKIRVGSIQISLDGARPETHDLVRGKKGLFSKTLRAIRESKERDFPVIVMTTLVEQNKDEMVEMGQLCKSLGVEGWCMNTFIPVGRAKKLNPVDLNVLSRIREQIGVSPAVCGNTACGVGFHKVAVLSNGNICPCEVLQSCSIGNVRYDNLLDVFYHHPLMEEYRKSTIDNLVECSGCPVNMLCKGGCKSSALVRNGTLFSADPTACHSWHSAIVNRSRKAV